MTHGTWDAAAEVVAECRGFRHTPFFAVRKTFGVVVGEEDIVDNIAARRLRVAFVGSWVPRRCGIATFTRDLREAVRRADPVTRTAVLAIDEPGASRVYDDAVIGRILQHDAESYRAAAIVIERWHADVVCVEHEFGLYGTDRDGKYADHLLGMLEALSIPAMTTFHTVLPHPEPWMREVVRKIANRSASIVVMADSAAQILVDVYGIARKPTVIMHGVPIVPPTPNGREEAKRRLGLEGREVVATFGLVDPRKGIEYAIDAIARVVERHPDVVYLIAGQTHPELVRHQGEAYREQLVDRVRALGLGEHVRFVNEYLTLDRIVEVLEATDVYVTPYLDPNQITSGTLAYALGAGRAVVSTPYLHAAEALAHDRGILTDFRSSDQIADALFSLLGDPERRKAMEARAYAYGRQAAWPAVGARTLALMTRLVTTLPRKSNQLALPLPASTSATARGHAA